MHRFFIPKPYKQEMQITGRDAHHIMDVLRMGTGDQLQVVADDGISFVGEITAVSMNTVTVSAKEILRETHEPDVRISLLQGLAKGEKMELIIQKAVEIGVVEISRLPWIIRWWCWTVPKRERKQSDGRKLRKRRPSRANGI